MRILLISSAFSGLTQRFYTEMDDAGYTVSVELHQGNIAALLEAVDLFKPDLILCPFLTKKLPAEIYTQTTCLIVHPGIKGDRGPSSLDWAIQGGETQWGVSLLEAADEMDAGPIWCHQSFTLREATKSSVFYREVTQAAVDCLWQALSFFASPAFTPEIQDYQRPDYRGRLLPSMKQADRAIDWKKHHTAEILRRIRAADGSPGVLDSLYGQPFYLFNAHKAEGLQGKAGEIIAIADTAICRATVDGAIWIGHLQAKLDSGAKGIKLPATLALQGLLPAHNTPAANSLFRRKIKILNIDYKQPGRQLPCQEVWYEIIGAAVYLYFAFHNGGMSSAQCQLLLRVYQHVASLPVKAIVLMGGEESWSNGIHLNHIEAAANPADESWLNINAMDDLVYQIITTMDKLTVAAVGGSAGAGGAILALAADRVYAREGVIFNPHYKNMGELYGSEYWTYLLPKRVGQEKAAALTEQRLPISAKQAWRLKLVDNVLDKQHSLFYAQVRQLVNLSIEDPQNLQTILQAKAKTRCLDESLKPLAAYRTFELTQMYINFYANEAYHQARRQFVYKLSDNAGTPLNIALHRQVGGINRKLSSGSLYHFAWQNHYALGDDAVDRQHKDLFTLAERLVASVNSDELSENIAIIYAHVQEHFLAEEQVMSQFAFCHRQGHEREHQFMLEKLQDIRHKIRANDWHQRDIHEFMNSWGKHILGSDQTLNHFLQQQESHTQAMQYIN